MDRESDEVETLPRVNDDQWNDGINETVNETVAMLIGSA